MPSVAAAAATVTTAAASLQPRTVPVPELLAPLLPWGGLRRGSVVATCGSTSLLLALLGAASAAGLWTAVVGRPDLGLLAAAESGVAVQRLALVPSPGATLADVVAALLDGIELVAVAGVQRLSAGQRQRLAGRVRQRGAVLLALGDWPGADVRLYGERIEWAGLGRGYGRLRSMRVTVRATGRGAAARQRTAEVVLVGSRAEPARATGGLVGPRRRDASLLRVVG